MRFMARARREGDKIVVEFECAEYYAFMNLLRNVSQYKGTSIGLVARSLLQKLEGGDERGKRV